MVQQPHHRPLALISFLLIPRILLQYFQGGDRAIVPGRIIRPRSVWSACMFSMCCGAVLFVAIYYIPIWFQIVKGASAVQSGINNLALILGVTVGSILGSALTTVWGQYAPLMVAGSPGRRCRAPGSGWSPPSPLTPRPGAGSGSRPSRAWGSA